MEYRQLSSNEIDRQIFQHFDRYQEVTQCWRKVDGTWMILDVPFIEHWGEKEFDTLITCLNNTLQTAGMVYGAFSDGKLKGFASVEGNLFGCAREYLDLSSLHVSRDLRGRSIGKRLFLMAAEWAKAHGAKKLYISAHSSVETQAFYKATGCIEAAEYNRDHVLKEPCDCQLEYDLMQ
jgi:GNAT superfamily N-acetyltransferase